MMKILLLSVVMTATFTTAQAQYSQDFETAPATNIYTISNNGPAANPKQLGSYETNPFKEGINTSDNCIKNEELPEAKNWAYPILEFGTGGFTLDETNGKILKINILSTVKTDFTMTLSPKVAGSAISETLTFTDVALNTWIEAVFDYSSYGDGYVARIDFKFDNNEGVYYLDNLKQVTPSKLSSKNFELKSVLVYPNPTTNTISISGDETITSVSVFDILGKEVLSFNGYNNLNVSQLNSGIYILKTNKGNTVKFVKK